MNQNKIKQQSKECEPNLKDKKKNKRGEIEKAHQFYGSFKIKNIVIKRK